MNSKIKLLLASLVVASLGRVYADDSVDAKTRGVKHYKCLRVGDLRVCNDQLIDGDLTVAGTISAANEVVNELNVLGDITVGGDLSVTGTICAGGFAICPTVAAGTPGVPGIGGDLAYGYFWNSLGSGTPVANNTGIEFDEVSIASGVSATLALPSANVTVADAGIYRLQFEVKGSTASNPSRLVFELFNVTQASAIAGSEFSSSIVTSTGTTSVATGFVLADLNAGDQIQLRNVTGVPVILDTVSTANSAALLVERVAA